ncbi:hypothetical protein CPB85DRAFT_1335994 [Mucidula mucida]|nr:hypothetical protein CPB85DRAFT_1335994 [Mucidula mucida]
MSEEVHCDHMTHTKRNTNEHWRSGVRDPSTSGRHAFSTYLRAVAVLRHRHHYEHFPEQAFACRRASTNIAEPTRR